MHCSTCPTGVMMSLTLTDLTFDSTVTKATSDEHHLLYGHVPPAQRLKSRRSFLSHVQPLTTSWEETRLRQLWTKRLEDDLPPTDMGIPPSEALPPGSEAPWVQWKTLNRLRTGTGRPKAAMARWGYETGQTTCECGEEDQTMQHCLVCPLLPNQCSSKDLAVFNKNAKGSVKKLETVIEPTSFKDMKRRRRLNIHNT